MFNSLGNFILNKQWSVIIGLLATALAFAMTEWAADIPVELVPLLGALVTWLRVWSKASVEEAVAVAGDQGGAAETTIGENP